VPVVVGETDPESAPVFRARAAECGSEIVFADATRGGDARAETAGGCVSGGHASDRAHNERRDGNALDKQASEYALDGRASAGVCAVDGCGADDCAPYERAAGYALDLAGDYQLKNVRTVLATVEALRGEGWAIPDAAVREGLAHTAELTGLQGRWQVVGRAPLTVLDTAHNAHGLAQVTRQIARQPHERLFMVLGVAGDKDVESIAPLLPPDAHYILTRANSPRSMPPQELARRLTQAAQAETAIPAANAECAPPNAECASGITHAASTGSTNSVGVKDVGVFATARTENVPIDPANVETTETVSAAIRRARALATPRDMIFIGGSNFIVAEALAENQNWY